MIITIENKNCIGKVIAKERNYENDELDPSEEYFRKKKKILMMKHTSLKKSQNRHIINNGS